MITSEPQLLSSGWINKSISAANFVDGFPALLVRDKVTGSLTLSEGGVDSNGEPIYPGAAGATLKQIAASGFTTAAARLVIETDLNSDGNPDVWATDTSARMIFYCGTTRTLMTGIASGSTGWSSFFTSIS